MKKAPGRLIRTGAFLLNIWEGLKKVSNPHHAVIAVAASTAVVVPSAAAEQKNQNEPAVGICSHCCCFRIHIRRSRRGEAESDNTAAIVSEQVVVGNTASIIAATAVVTSRIHSL